MLRLIAPAAATRAARPSALRRADLHHNRVCRTKRRNFVLATSGAQDDTDPTAQLTETLGEASKYVQAKWESIEDKPAAVIVAAAAFVGLYAVSSVVDAVDRIPIFSSFLELIGLVVSGWLGFRLLTVEADRKELLSTMESFVEKVIGKK